MTLSSLLCASPSGSNGINILVTKAIRILQCQFHHDAARVWTCLVPSAYFMYLQKQVNQPEKSLAAGVIGPLPTLLWPFPLSFCRHKAVVPRGGCQLQRSRHETRLRFSWRDSPCLSVVAWGRFLGTRQCLSLCPSFQLYLPAFSWLCSLFKRSGWRSRGSRCARDVILTPSAPKKINTPLSLCKECFIDSFLSSPNL